MKRLIVVLALAFLGAPATAHADEGMWLFTKPPTKYLWDNYKFKIDAKWLEHVQKSSVRFPGGSGSFLSADGLVFTNHHVGSDAIQRLSKKDKDFLKDGYHAKSHADELKCEGLELNVLQSIEDVTAKVNAAVKPELKPDEAFAARRAAIAKIEIESTDQTKLKSQVVTLYQGAQYHLYCFKKYTDVRLVFAPEQQIAFFGGDPDNFEYPRFDLDICFFRCYENDKPAKVEHYFQWSRYGPAKDELVFVSGHPGRTSRLNTVAELEYLRDTGLPYVMQRLNRWEVLAKVYGDRSAENARQVKDFKFGVENGRKALTGEYAGLLDPELMKKKIAAEKQLRDHVKNNDTLKDAADAWDKIANAQSVRQNNIRRHVALEGGAGFFSELFSYARDLLRAADEREKDDGERLEQYSEASLPSLKLQLLSPQPIYDQWEIVRLADGLTFLCETLGAENDLVQKVLAGKSPRDRAAELIKGTKLNDLEERKKLFEGGKKAVDESKDLLIALARLVDKDSRAVRKIFETQVDEVKRQAYGQIAKAKYALEGDSVYPDATFTLRLAFGQVKGYDQDGKHIPFETTFAGLYERANEHNNKHPFDLPPIWLQKKDKLNLKTPFNFVCTADIIGGNSGSPVINKHAEVVGIIFDSNLQSLVSDFVYSDKQGRAVAVHSAGIVEALTKVYEANQLVNEILGKQ